MLKGNIPVTVVTCGLDKEKVENVSKRLEKTLEQHLFFDPLGRIVCCTFLDHDTAKNDEALTDQAKTIGHNF
jgi:hypothetical protein